MPGRKRTYPLQKVHLSRWFSFPKWWDMEGFPFPAKSFIRGEWIEVIIYRGSKIVTFTCHSAQVWCFSADDTSKCWVLPMWIWSGFWGVEFFCLEISYYRNMYFICSQLSPEHVATTWDKRNLVHLPGKPVAINFHQLEPPKTSNPVA